MFPSAHSPVQVCSSTRFDILVKHLSERLEYKFFSPQVESSQSRSDNSSGHVNSDGWLRWSAEVVSTSVEIEKCGRVLRMCVVFTVIPRVWPDLTDTHWVWPDLTVLPSGYDRIWPIYLCVRPCVFDRTSYILLRFGYIPGWTVYVLGHVHMHDQHVKPMWNSV